MAIGVAEFPLRYIAHACFDPEIVGQFAAPPTANEASRSLLRERVRLESASDRGAGDANPVAIGVSAPRIRGLANWQPDFGTGWLATANVLAIVDLQSQLGEPAHWALPQSAVRWVLSALEVATEVCAVQIREL